MLNERFAGQHFASKNLQAESSPEPSQSGTISEISMWEIVNRHAELARMYGEAEGMLTMILDYAQDNLPDHFHAAISGLIDRADDFFRLDKDF